MRLLSPIGLAFALLLAASSAHAATIDLTGAIGSQIGAGNSGSVVYSGNSDFGNVTFSANAGSSDLTFQSGGGLGIDCHGGSISCILDNRNQIDTGEVLSISFAQPLFVTSVDIRNLFGTNLGFGRFSVHFDEGGTVAGSNFEIGFDSDDAGANGALNLVVNRWASSLSFVPNGGFFDAFSVAGLSIDELAGAVPPPNTSPIPEPSSILLMLIGGGLVATQIRKRS